MTARSGLTGFNTAPFCNTKATDPVSKHWGAVPHLFHIYVSGATTAWTVVDDMPERVYIVDVWNVAHGANGGATARVDNGASAVSDAMAAAVADTVTHAATLDDTYRMIEKHGTLKVTTAASADADVYILCTRLY